MRWKPVKPDLVFIGGLSQRGDVDSIREVIRLLRQPAPGVEILGRIMAAWFATG